MFDKSDNREVQPGAMLKPGLRTNNAEHGSADVEADEVPPITVLIVEPAK